MMHSFVLEVDGVRVATLLDRPYRRIAHDLPVRYVGFVVPDEYFVGYGFDLDERYRNLPELRIARFRQA
jgi:hypoxanthine phosphoribosyltransferase